MFDHAAGLQSGSGGNVGQSPCGLKLHFPVVLGVGSVSAQELDELRHNAGLDQRVNRWIAFAGKDFPGGLGGFESGIEVA